MFQILAFRTYITDDSVNKYESKYNNWISILYIKSITDK